ncbi:MAG: HIT domain-containing protein [Planctomycetes bacterium]|nr:HIT domain-containing protein [Planctomycetota bacterium]
MAEFHKNVWAPWRMEYIAGLAEPADGECFFCHYRDHPEDDQRNGVLWRRERSLTVLNRFPYTNGHLLVAPTAHIGDLEALPDEVLTELTLRIRDAQRVLGAAVHAHGFNIGMNLGRCAGAGLPEHLHWHVVPRWKGDTNFMPVVGDVRVISQGLDEVARLFRTEAARLGL